MKKLIICLSLLAVAAWGVSFSTLESEGTLTVVGVSTFQAATVFPVGAAATPSIYFAGDANSGFYHVGADDIGVSAAGALVGDFDGTGLNNCALGQTTPGAADVTTLTTTGQTDLDPGAVGAPSLAFTGSLTTGLYEVAADSPGMAVGGANIGTWDAAGYQGDIGQTVPGAADVTTLTTTGQTDLDPGAVGAPSVAFTGSLTTGLYQTAADEVGVAVGGANVGTWDATGLGAVGFNGPIGTVVPAAGTFTDVNVGDDFNFGQNPEDLIGGYSGRGEYITFVDTFDVGNDADLAVRWNVAGVVGAGTNEETTRDGWNTLITGGAGGPDMESTVTNGLNHYSDYAPRIEAVVELAAVAAGQNFYFGFYAAANRFAEIIHEPATSANWLLRVDDTAGAETIDSGVAAVLNTPTKLEISVTAGGVVDWAIDDVDMPTVGLTNLMTNGVAHYVEWRLLDVAAAAHTARVDYFMSEQLRQQ